MKTAFRFLLLLVILNVVRYIVGGLLEGPFVMPSLMAAMEARPEVFASEFTTIDSVLVFPIVAVANGLLYSRLMGSAARS